MSIRRSRPIADKLLRKMQRYQQAKVVDLKAFKAGKQLADSLGQTVASNSQLAALHPAHAMYVYAQNQLSVMAEQLTMLKELDRLNYPLAEAEECYMPSGPPMSPLTRSYFTCWSLFDVSAGIAKETLCTTAMAVGRKYGAHEDLLQLFEHMQESYMAVYRHEGHDGESIVLRELVTDRVCRTLCASGYQGSAGELWYVRVLPPPVAEFDQHIVFTTPYLLISPGEDEWLAYLDRVLSDVAPAKRHEAYRQHMKYGPVRTYWPEFVFEAYVNFRPEVVFLEGLPDVAESRPCSSVSLRRQEE